MSLNALVSEIEKARNRLAELVREAAILRAHRKDIEDAPPHTDDIVHSFRRGLAQAEASFIKQLGWSLNNKNATKEGAGLALKNYAVHPLTPHATNPGYDTILPPSVQDWTAPPVSIVALLYFLRDRIGEEIPALVDKLCPAARAGMKQADREKLMREYDEQIAVLEADAEILRNELASASNAATGR